MSSILKPKIENLEERARFLNEEINHLKVKEKDLSVKFDLSKKEKDICLRSLDSQIKEKELESNRITEDLVVEEEKFFALVSDVNELCEKKRVIDEEIALSKKEISDE